MQERHDVLSRTIGYLDEEQEALDRGYFLLICSTVTMVIGTLLQILFFYLYNGPFHPFANILVDETEGKKRIDTWFFLMIVPFYLFHFLYRRFKARVWCSIKWRHGHRQNPLKFSLQSINPNRRSCELVQCPRNLQTVKSQKKLTNPSLDETNVWNKN